MLVQLKVCLSDWARGLTERLAALYLASRDQRTPGAAKVMALLVVAYALSPIDLIPDFIPVVGYLDDLVILPLGFWLAIKLIPAPLWSSFVYQAKEQPPVMNRIRGVLTGVVLVWVLMVSVISLLFLL